MPSRPNFLVIVADDLGFSDCRYEDIVAGVNPFFQTAVTALHMEDAEYSTKLPEGFYSSKTYASKVIEFLSEHPESEKGKPFFAYLPFTAPHWPLQAPESYVDKYRGKYNDGSSALRLKRLERLKELGLVAPDLVPHEVVTGPGDRDRETMNDEDRAKSARAMEVYAAVVEVMDKNIGRAMDYFRQSGGYDSTIICFMSDNGAEGASYEASPLGGRGRKIERVRDVSWKPSLDAITVGGADTSTAPASIHGEEHVTGWEIAGSGALRKGRYKITYVPLSRGPQRWELFDIVEDPGETRDLSKEKPEIFNELLRLWAIYAEEVGVAGLAGQISANNQVVEGVKDEFEDPALLARKMCHVRYKLGFPNDLEVIMYWTILAADVLYIGDWKLQPL
ncbi:alkaline phosphatase-like protein [Aspergillus novofumigatus IBT 16806]|uniref:Alkaline phosphatase-like protein n=1 Tax=Aspergillus novofumigatus (strain IBT 16806) TaxID=1392255 RepID=A0A2I1BVN9_ASPN1|nr:alkaline phosphatase-like protein [Aspergillus novofumigatus IBT 16806]PKX89444.1 alkaline phosphatase-like protein [Aspergillus novofumigatus IBT 16806]